MFFASQHIYAQYFNYTNYDVDNGFPQSNANFIMQDNEGYIWFATQNGVAKFDGFNYKIIDKTNGLHSNLISHILQTKDGTLWFSTKKGLTKFHDKTFKTYTIKDDLYSSVINFTFELPNSNILIVTQEGTVVLQNNSIIKISKNIIPEKIIYRNNGQVLAISNTNIYSFSNNTFVKQSLLTKSITPPFYSFTEDKENNIWISAKGGLYKIEGGKIKHYGEKDGLIAGKIDNLIIDNENNLWYSSEEIGCGFFKNNEFHNLTLSSGLTNNAVLYLFEDKENNIWIGGRNGATMINTKNPFIHYDKISPFYNEIVMGMTKGDGNDIWFTTFGNGITKFDGKKYTYFTKKNGNIDNHFFDIEKDTKGNFLLSSANNGVVKFDGKHFTKIKTKNKKQVDRRILTSFKDSQNNIWFGTNGSGIYKYDGKKLINFGKKFNLEQESIMSFCEDDENNIWFGVINKGLYLYNRKNLIKLKSEFDFSYIRTIVNRNGTIWLGTSSNGIFKVLENSNNYTFTKFSKKDGLNSNNIYILFPDLKGNLWCGSEKGVDKITFNKYNQLSGIKSYTKDEGFIGIETNINAALEDKDGYVWFGTVNGAVKYNEESDKVNTFENNTYITDIKLFFKKVNWKQYADTIDKNGFPINLILPYDKNHLSFNYIGLCYSNPKKVKYKYRLLGQNINWSPPTSDKKAIFTNIAPGKYEFQIISANNDGIWNIEPVTFKFKIKPPIWKEMWFLTLSLLFLLLVTYFIINYRIQSLKKAKNVLKQKVKERTAEINEQKEELKKTNKNITDSIDYSGKIQAAMFPSLNIFKNNFSEFFILNKPKDILSGDFYWAKEIIYKGVKQIIFVTADSTGHGIPGALVSMLGMSLLNEIVRKEHIIQPNQVLEELRKEIKTSLKQTGALNDQSEGIDMIICSINTETLEMQHSGANSPMYILRNKEIIVLNPTFNPVGIFIKEIPFKHNNFQLQKNDIIYSFSDGYVDQFKEKTGEKFKVKRFRDLLININNQPLKRQKMIINAIHKKWKGDTEQVDDILIVGLKI